MMKCPTLLLALLALCCGMTASAQSFKDGPHVGFVTGGDTEDPDVAFGWQAAYEFNDVCSLELSVTHMRDKLSGDNLDVGDFSVPAKLQVDIWAVALTAQAGHLIGERVYLHGGGGVGYYFFTDKDMEEARRDLAATGGTDSGRPVLDEDVDIDNDFGFHLTVGVDVLLKQSWEFFVDYRAAFLETDSERTSLEVFTGSDGQPRQTNVRRSGNFSYDYGLLRLGFNYRF